MSIQSSDIQWRLSGGAANADPALSIGGAKSATVVGALLDDSEPDETDAGRVEYRCIYVHNAHPNLVLQNASVWIGANTASAATQIEIGLGSSVSNGTEQETTDDTTAPTGVTFSLAPSKASGIAIGNLPAGHHRAIWVKRAISTGAPQSSDIGVLRVEGDSA